MILLFLKGIGIGLSVILPGMSAGTAALIFGIYNWMISQIRKFEILELWPVLAGAALGVLFGARAITQLLAVAPSLVLSFLLGLVLASAAVVLRDVGPVTWPKVFIGLLTLSVAWLMAPAPVSSALEPEAAAFGIFVSGMLSSAAMVLPGISGSSMMIIMGQYERMLNAIVTWDWLLLGIFGLGALAGIFGFAHIISALLRYFKNYTMVALAGLMVGAARALFPTTFGLPELAVLVMGVLLVSAFRRQGDSTHKSR